MYSSKLSVRITSVKYFDRSINLRAEKIRQHRLIRSYKLIIIVLRKSLTKLKRFGYSAASALAWIHLKGVYENSMAKRYLH